MLARRMAAVLTLGAMLGPTPVLGGHPARAAADACGNQLVQPGQVLNALPWHQGLLRPEEAWMTATGMGQTVAVLDSGVDDLNPQLHGRVLPGFDVLRNQPDSGVDCVGTGTAAAGVIAARPAPGIGLQGIAPDAMILPVRFTNANPADYTKFLPAQLAQAIEWAAGHGATVIDVSAASPDDDPAVRRAVARALVAGITVVAAAGDHHNPNGLPEPVVDAPTFPANYPGVIGVGAVGREITRVAGSDVGPYVALVAPGDGVVSTARIAGHQTASGSAVAAALVAATAALVRQAYPGSGPADVARRITATADPAPGGEFGMAYGRGIVDPYRAVTEPLSANAGPVRVPGLAPSPPDPAAAARARWWHATTTRALLIAGAAVFLLILVGVAIAVIPRGRRTRWRSARAPRPVDPPPPPVDGIAEDIFAAPTPRPHQPSDRVRRGADRR